MGRQGGVAARNASSAVQSRVPVYRSPAPSSMEAGRQGGSVLAVQDGVRPEKLAMRRIKAGAVALPSQYAILGLAQIRNAHGKPYADGHQGDRKSNGSDVGEHALAKVIRVIPGALIARQIIGLGTVVFRFSRPGLVIRPARRTDRVAWPELEHLMLLLRRNGPLGFHCCQSRGLPDVI
jgi:hypothetical protein